MPNLRIIIAVILSSVSMLIPVSGICGIADQGFSCTGMSCPSYSDIYNADPKFKSAFQKAISVAKIKQPGWFPNGVGGIVQAISLGDHKVLYAEVCQPHNCPHAIKVFYDVQNNRVYGVYYTDMEIGPMQAIKFGAPTSAEIEYIQKLEVQIYEHPLTTTSSTQADVAKSQSNLSLADQQKQLNSCLDSNPYRILRVESDILENKKSIHFYESVIQHEQDAAQYSGFVDKEKMYNAGQEIAQLKKMNSVNFNNYKKMGGPALTAESVVATPDPCAALNLEINQATNQAEIDRQNQIKATYHKTVIDFSTCDKPNYPRNAMRNGEQGSVKLFFLINTDGHVIDSKVEQSSGSRALDYETRSALSRCKFQSVIIDGLPVETWAETYYIWKLPSQ